MGLLDRLLLLLLADSACVQENKRPGKSSKKPRIEAAVRNKSWPFYGLTPLKSRFKELVISSGSTF